MSHWLPAWPMFAAFIAASLVLAVTPGPGVFYIVTRSLLHGRRSGLASVAGVALGNLGNMLGATLGLVALFALSATAFTAVKFAGAGYLVWLGVRTLRTRAARPAENAPPDRVGHAFRDGFLVALLNPKTAMFFAAFLPQFVAPAGAATQTVTLGLTFIAIAATTDSLYALGAGVVAPRLPKAGGAARSARYLSAGAFIGLGLFAALAGTRPMR